MTTLQCCGVTVESYGEDERWYRNAFGSPLAINLGDGFGDGRWHGSITLGQLTIAQLRERQPTAAKAARELEREARPFLRELSRLIAWMVEADK